MKRVKQILAIAMVVMTAVVFTPMVPGAGSAAFADDEQQVQQEGLVEAQGTGTVIAVKVVATGVVKLTQAIIDFVNYESNLQEVEGGTYVIDHDVTVNHGFLIRGNVTLAIMDGCTLTIDNDTQNDPGICVPDDSHLNITGACGANEPIVKGTGKLIVKGSGGGAGIGGTQDDHDPRTKDCGGITIESITVEAIGGGGYEGSGIIKDDEPSGGAGIGGGNTGAGTGIVIRSGNVKAIGGFKAAGIGSGDDGGINDRGGSDITILGGTVYAEGGAYAAGIGGGYGSGGFDITIEDGNVTAKGGVCAPGIGAGRSHTGKNPEGHDIDIDGGTVYAYGGGSDNKGGGYGAAIGSGYDKAAHDITLDGGNIYCYPGNAQAPGIGGGMNGNTEDIKVNGADIWVKGIVAIGTYSIDTDNNNKDAKNITVNSGSVTLSPFNSSGAEWANSVCIGVANKGKAENIKINGGSISIEGNSKHKATLIGVTSGRSDNVTGKTSGIKVYTGLTIYKDYKTGEKMANSGGDLKDSFRGLPYARIVDSEYVRYVTASGNVTTAKATRVTSNYIAQVTAAEDDSDEAQDTETIVLSDKITNGFYYVDGDTLVENSLRCDGNIKLILKDGSKLTAKGVENKAGIKVGKNDRLTVYTGEAGSGIIKAIGGSKAAGIGSDYKAKCGKINVVGGYIVAKAGAKAAAVGSGYKGKIGVVKVNKALKVRARTGKHPLRNIINRGGNLIKLLKSKTYVLIGHSVAE